jgi:hypothetical protein
LGKINAAPPKIIRSAAAMLGAISVMLSTSKKVKGTLLFVSLNIEVGYCREVEPDLLQKRQRVGGRWQKGRREKELYESGFKAHA